MITIVSFDIVFKIRRLILFREEDSKYKFDLTLIREIKTATKKGSSANM